MKKTFVAAVVTAVALAFGCVSYNAGTLHSLSDRNLGAAEITVEMCRDFGLAAQAAINGEDDAFFLLGKASELRGLSVGLSKHSIQCFSVVERLNREGNPMSEFNHGALLTIFKRSWSNVKILAGEDE